MHIDFANLGIAAKNNGRNVQGILFAESNISEYQVFWYFLFITKRKNSQICNFTLMKCPTFNQCKAKVKNQHCKFC